MTQVGFNEFIMVGYETYRSWEEGSRILSSPGYAILVIAKKYPNVFIKHRKEILKDYRRFAKRGLTINFDYVFSSKVKFYKNVNP